MKSYRFFLESSKYFLDSYSTCDAKEKEYATFASVLFSWTALESYVNMRFESLSQGSRIKPHERAFLLEEELKVDSEGKFVSITIHPTLSKKILFLIEYFSKVSVATFKTKFGRDLTTFEDLRNKIVHYKEGSINAISFNKANEYRDFVLNLIKYLNRHV